MIVVAGEALVDLIVGADGALAAHHGGGPYNAVRAISRLGGRAAFLGAISTDRFGRDLLADLVEDGVDTGCVVATDAPTTLALAELGADGSASYRFYLDGTSAPSLTADAAHAALAGVDVEVLHIGTLALAIEPVGTTVESLAAAAPADVLLVVDPNCRPSAIADADAYRARIDRLAARADVVKVSTDDAAYLSPGAPPADTARSLAARGARVVLLTDGGGPVHVVTAGGELVVEPPDVDVVDTVGAGDAFGAGFITWWRRHGLGRAELGDLDRIGDATRFAVRVAALTCARAGGAAPRLGEVLGDELD